MTPRELYDTHAGIAERIGRKYAARHPAHWDDLMQAARLGLWKACLNYDPARAAGDRFEGYAAQRVQWAVLDGWRDLDHMATHDRRAAKRGERPAVTLHAHSEWTDPPALDADPGDAVAAREAAGAALEHLACLPAPMRDVFARYALNDEPLAVIAAEYGQPADWAYFLRRQAIKQLRARLEAANERCAA